ncbi:MAG TPA: hypothetical protein VED37_00630 [Ktedonobacteraceae bacterium]|nr:hypothetical protein [Ktedonobacteraceae bacterium]
MTSKMNYAILSQSMKHLRVAFANGVGNPQSIGLHNWMEQTTTKVDFFAVHAVKRSFALLQALFVVK